jgi:uncharacterized RDD family membrane protein YckC
MQNDQHTFSKTPISLSFDDFDINVESFKPVTKGLGFHHEQKKTTFKPITHPKIESFRSNGPLSNISSNTESKIRNQAPTGLEAFYGTTSAAIVPTESFKDIAQESNVGTAKIQENIKNASSISQFLAWLIDISVISALLVLTGVCLVLASGMNYQLILKLISKMDIIIFSSSIFAIYYILYFTILDLSTSPGKLLLGLRLVATEGDNLTVKNTFTRSAVSLLSIFAFCFPMLLDFQGRLSDTKIIK